MQGFANSSLRNQSNIPTEQVQHLLHELRLHQIELELQNEELRSAQLLLELERSRYFDLYDLAPVAYCTLSDKGLILQANLTSAILLGVPRLSLLKLPFTGFILRADQNIYYQHGQELMRSGEPQSCQLRMLKANGDTFWGNLVSTVQAEPDGTLQRRMVINDVSDQKRTSLAERKTELALGLLRSQEQSRQHFSRELHDRTSANLAALRLNLELILATAAPMRDTLSYTECVADTWALLEDTNNGIRDICQDLHPPAFAIGGFSAAVKSYAHALQKRTGLTVQVEGDHREARLPCDLELSLFRIVQEALTNCIKHARANMVTVNLQLATHPLQISITDDGIGFDPQAQASMNRPEVRQRPGQGLHHMQQAAEFINAIFWVESAPGRGTCISLELPYPTEAPKS